MTTQDKIVSLTLEKPLPARSEYPIHMMPVRNQNPKAVASYEFGVLKDDPLSEDEKKVYFRMLHDHHTLKVGKSVGVDFGEFQICIHRVKRQIWLVCCHWDKTEEAKID